jgi:hypothetical protein
MRQKNTLKQVAFMLLVAFIVLACSSGALAATATPVPTNTATPAPTNTATPKPTKTPLPTATLEPTPAPVGVPVQSESYEVVVSNVRRLDSGVHTGDGYYWSANPGYVFIELEVKVSNLRSSEASVSWGDIYVVESSGDAWYPNWGGSKAVESGSSFAASSLSVSSIDDGGATISFADDLYLRVIYIVTESDPTTVLFGFADSPKIEVVVKK